MEMLPVGVVRVPEERIRREFDQNALDDLEKSIRQIGIINPPTARKVNGEFVLSTGERRLRAMKQIIAMGDRVPLVGGALAPIDHIPIVLHEELSNDDLIQVELEENVLRRDLTWQERTKGYADLHALRQVQAEGDGADYTIKATATELAGGEPTGEFQRTVSQALVLAKHLDNPVIAGAKNEKEALNLLKKDMEKTFLAELGELAEKSTSRHTLIHGNAREVLLTFEDELYDIILTDPPYGVGADDWLPQSGSNSGVRHFYEDSFEIVEELMDAVIPQWTRVTKDNAHLYMFCDIRLWNYWRVMFEKNAIWRVWPVPLIWSKNGRGNIIGTVDGPRRTYEAVLYARKGAKLVQRVGADVLSHTPVSNAKHPAQKPVSLYTELLSWSGIPGQLVLDSFAGSGTIFPACNKLNLTATAIERDKDSCNVAFSRMNETSETEPDSIDF